MASSCKISTRLVSIKTPLCQQTQAIWPGTEILLVTFHRLSKMHKAFRAMLPSSTVMDRLSIRVGTTSRSQMIRTSKLQDVWSVQKAATWRELSRNVVVACLSRKRLSNSDWEEKAVGSKKVQSKRSQKNHSIFASALGFSLNTQLLAAKSSSYFSTCMRITKSTAKSWDAT